MKISGTKENSPFLLETMGAVRTPLRSETELDYIHDECLVALRRVTLLLKPRPHSSVCTLIYG